MTSSVVHVDAVSKTFYAGMDVVHALQGVDLDVRHRGVLGQVPVGGVAIDLCLPDPEGVVRDGGQSTP